MFSPALTAPISLSRGTAVRVRVKLMQSCCRVAGAGVRCPRLDIGPLGVDMWIAIILVTQSFAADIGLETPPEQPEYGRKTWGNNEFRSNYAAEIRPPGELVPWNYVRHQRAVAGRFYDAEGNVYSAGQAVVVLDECKACERHMDDYHRHDKRASAWSTANVVSILIMWPGILLCTPMTLVESSKATQAMGRAVKEFNSSPKE